MSNIKILLSDPQYLSCEGLKQLIVAVSGFQLTGDYYFPEDLKKGIQDHQPDVVIFDFEEFPDFSWEMVRELRALFPAPKWLLVSNSGDKQHIFKALEVGVQSILTKNCSREEIIGAIRATSRNEKFFCNKVLEIILEKHLQGNETPDCQPSSLTAREQEILILVANGNSTRQIVGNLSLSPHTVNTHRKNIMKKLGVGSVSELVLYAVNAGLISAGKNDL